MQATAVLTTQLTLAALLSACESGSSSTLRIQNSLVSFNNSIRQPVYNPSGHLESRYVRVEDNSSSEQPDVDPPPQRQQTAWLHQSLRTTQNGSTSQHTDSGPDARKLLPVVRKKQTFPPAPTRTVGSLAAAGRARHAADKASQPRHNPGASSPKGIPGPFESPRLSTLTEATPKQQPRTTEPARPSETQGTPERKEKKARRSLFTSDSTRISKQVSQTTHVVEPKDEEHVHFGAEETLKCIQESMYKGGYEKYADQFRKDHHSSTDNPVYKEIYAAKGSMEGRLSADLMRNGTDRFKEKMKCKVSPVHVYYAEENELCCAVRIRVPEGLYVAVEIQKHAGDGIVLYEPNLIRAVTDDFAATESKEAVSRVFVGFSNVVNVLQIVKLKEPYKGHRFKLRFVGLRRQGLQVRLTAPNRGVVHTPFHHGRTQLLKKLKDPWAAVNVPSGHVVMVSSPEYEGMKRCVALHAGDRGNETLARVCRGDYDPPRATIYNTSLLLVHAYREFYRRQEGFQLWFSFHNASALPTKLPNGSWDCAVAYAPDFLHHLSCNMEAECRDAEDEAHCPYTTGLCGPGYLTLGGGCFFYVRRWQRKLSWETAAEMCARRGGRLASLTSKAKWEDMLRVLHTSSYRDEKIFVGVKRELNKLPPWYTVVYSWTDGTVASKELNLPSELHLFDAFIVGCNSKVIRIGGYVQFTADCTKKQHALVLNNPRDKEIAANVLCEKPLPLRTKKINVTGRWPREDDAYIRCPLGHYTHQFLACDVQSSCWPRDHSRCRSPQTLRPPTFKCTNGIERVPYTLVCDFRDDCVNGTDERFCYFPRCRRNEFTCDNKQCIPSTKLADGWEDCHNGEDEKDFVRRMFHERIEQAYPYFVSVSGKGEFNFLPLKQKGACPDTHFQCLNNGNCLPVFMLCNGVYDCPGHEDEVGCDACPGFYRCRNSKVCVHYSELCDGRVFCPQHDDELMCNTTCPPSCVCWGLAFYCGRHFAASSYPRLRYLDATGSAMTPAHLNGSHLMINLILAECGLARVESFVLRNLLFLDVRDNRLSTLSSVNLDGCPQLRALSLAGNPLGRAFEGEGGLDDFPNLLNLDLSRSRMPVLNVTSLSVFPKLQVLNLSHSGVRRVRGETFNVVGQLNVIDFRGCPTTWFPRGVFQGLKNLRVIHADNYKLCCPAVLPEEFESRNCFAPPNAISSCDNLLRGQEYSVYIFVLSLLATSGNVGSFVFRSFVSTWESSLGCQHLVTHLSVSDFLMGVYLLVIGVADRVYDGNYLWNDVAWRHSSACKFAGFLSLLSSEVSVLVVCLISVDRFLAVHFSFCRLKFTAAAARAATVVVWIAGVALAFVPLLPAAAHWEFYSQSGVCTAFPISDAESPGRGYSFGVLVVFNLVLFGFTGAAQLSVYFTPALPAVDRNSDLLFARRLVSVAMTDFLCWFSIGVLGSLARGDVPISVDVSAALVVFVLPLNSALNPYLYIFNVIRERRNRAREEKLHALLLAQLRKRN